MHDFSPHSKYFFTDMQIKIWNNYYFFDLYYKFRFDPRDILSLLNVSKWVLVQGVG